ncbi:MAG: site-2 protease family protein [Verrucomicrobiota bacterium]
MKHSLRLGSAFGIGIFVHWTFALLPLWVVFATLGNNGGIAAAIGGVVFICAVFGCVVLHELGHSLAARHYGIPTRSITLLPIGGVAALERMPTNPRQELVIAIAGPMVNVFIAGFLALVGYTFGLLNQITGALNFAAFTTLSGLLNALLVTNIILVIFNMIPAFPMDGGRVFRALLSTKIGHLRATDIAALVGKVLAVGIGVWGLFIAKSPFTAVLAAFVWLAGEQERRYAHAFNAHRNMMDGNEPIDVEVIPPDSPVGRRFVVKWPR